MGLKMWKTYNKVKDVFTKPKLHFKFSRWQSSPNLPVWRRGPHIYLVNQFKNKNVYRINNCVNVKVGTSTYTTYDDKERTCDRYEFSCHELPKGYKQGDLVWKRDIRKKLKKFKLSWLNPVIKLPIWLSFHFWSHDLWYKTKWTDTDFRFEFPPQMTLVVFGYAFSWWLKAPGDDNFYWEGVLHYLYGKEGLDPLKRAIFGVGVWKRDDKKFLAFSKDFLKPKYHGEYDSIITEINLDNET